MEIIFKTTKDKSNFTYFSELFKNKKILNGFNKLSESLLCEQILNNRFMCRNVKFEDKIKGKLYICYPLTVVVKFDVEFDSLYSLISEIRKAYKKIYKDRNTMIKCGVWGHDIGDLCIESIRVCEDNSIEVGIGS